MLIGAAALLLLAVAGVGAFAIPGSHKDTIQGTFTLLSPGDVAGGATDCKGTGGYDDVSPGTKVTVRDENDKIVGAGALRSASSAKEIAERYQKVDDSVKSVDEAAATFERGNGVLCVLLFDVDVDAAKFYDIEVGRRGKISQSRSELIKNKWVAQFSLGE